MLDVLRKSSMENVNLIIALESQPLVDSILVQNQLAIYILKVGSGIVNTSLIVGFKNH